MSLFITFEGGEGTGKSTQIELLRLSLEGLGRKVLQHREPGGSPLGEYLRAWLMDNTRSLEPASELLLFTAARAELVQTVLKPKLNAGFDILLDRYADSTTVYQGFARNVPMRYVNSANNLAKDGLTPELTILLDAPPEISLERASQRDGAKANQPRFENADIAFHHKVRSGFLKLASRSPETWLVINAELGIQEIHSTILAKVRNLIF